MSKRCYYEVLGVERDADGATLKRAYRKLAVKFHPDRNPDDPDAEDRFKEAAEAYEVLSDTEKRGLYDRYGHDGLKRTGFSGFSGFDDIFSHFGDIFGDIFGFGASRGGGRRQRRGADLRMELGITFEEAVKGTTREVPVEHFGTCETCEGSGMRPGSKPAACTSCGGRGQVVHSQGLFMISTACPRCGGSGQFIQDPCESCGGQGRTRKSKTVTVKIPAGVDDGTRMRLAGEGDSAGDAAGSGDLYIFLHVEPHDIFERDGNDLRCEVPVSIVEATLGGTIEVPTLDGATKAKIPAGSQPGDVIRLKSLGVPYLRGRGTGDLYAHLRVVVPKKVNRKQRELLEQFAALAK